MFGFLHPLTSKPPSQYKWSPAHGTGHAAGQTVDPSVPKVFGKQVSGFGHPAGSFPPGQVIMPGHCVGQKAGQLPVAEYLELKIC